MPIRDDDDIVLRIQFSIPCAFCCLEARRVLGCAGHMLRPLVLTLICPVHVLYNRYPRTWLLDRAGACVRGACSRVVAAICVVWRQAIASNSEETPTCLLPVLENVGQGEDSQRYQLEWLASDKRMACTALCLSRCPRARSTV